MGMREKLSLLSRTILSPPNPRVSGGFPLLLGGYSPLHHGGSIPPHQLGLNSTLLHRVSLTPTPTHPLTPKLFPRHLSQTLTVSPPHQQPHPPPTTYLALPSLNHSLPFSLAFPYKHHHQNPKPLLKINPAHIDAISAITLPRDLLRPPRTTAMSSRPPPEPPPLEHNTVLEDPCAPVCFWSGVSSHLRKRVAHHVIEGLVVFRPPPKPPWTYLSFVTLLRLNLVLLWLLLCPLLLNKARHRAALKLLVKSPQRVSGVFCILLCVFWQLIVTEEAHVTSTFHFGLSKYLSAIVSQGNWLNLENKISRNVSFRSQKSSGLDLEKKTRASLFVIAKEWERKLLIVWLLDWRHWFVYVPIVPKQSMSCDSNVYIVFVEMMLLGCGWEMSQHTCFPSSCNVAFDFY